MASDSEDRAGAGRRRGRTHVEVVHGLIGDAEVVEAVLESGIMLVGLQKVLQQALLPQVLTNGFKSLQRHPAQGLQVRAGPASLLSGSLPPSR